MISTILKLLAIFWLLAIEINSRRVRHMKRYQGRNIEDSIQFDFIAIIAHIPDFNNVQRTECLCAIISIEWAITTAQCVSNHNDGAGDLYVWYRNFTKLPVKRTDTSKVVKSFVHGSFQSSFNSKAAMPYDVGLLRLDNVRLTNYGLLSAVDHHALIGLIVLYGGGVERSNQSLNKALYGQSAPLSLDRGMVVRCDKISRYRTEPSMLCLAHKCVSKSKVYSYAREGGPIILDNKIVGLMSVSKAPEFGVTPIGLHVGWIKSLLNSNTNIGRN